MGLCRILHNAHLSQPISWRPFKIIFNSKTKLIIFIWESCSSVLPILCIGSTTLLFKTPPPKQSLGHFEFKTLFPLSSAFCKADIFLDQAIQPAIRAELVEAGLRLSLSANVLNTTQAVWFLQVLPRSSFKRLVLGTTLWQHTKMSTVLKSPKGLKDWECKKGQLSSWSSILYVPPMELVTTKKAPGRSLKIKLPNRTVFNMSIFSQGNTEEYLAPLIVVLLLINQKELDVQCRRMAKAVDKLAGTLENLQKPAWPKGATSNDEQESCKVEVAHSQEMLQEARKAHNEAVAKTNKWASCLVTHSPNGIRFAVRCTSVTCGLEWMVKWPQEGICIRGLLSKTVLSYISSQSSLLTQPKGSSSTYSRWCTSSRGLLCDSISHKLECWMTTSDFSPHWRTAPSLYQQQRKGTFPLARLI